VGLAKFAVGRQAELAELEQHLEFVSQGKSGLKFLSGDYGSGKSFFCALVRERAFDKGFASSTIIVSPDAPLGKLEVIVGKTFDGIRVPEKRTACGLADLLERWLFQMMKKAATLEGLNISDPKAFGRLSAIVLKKIEEELSVVQGLEASFVNAVKTYLHARVQRDGVLINDVLGWLKRSANLGTSRKNQIGVRGDISPAAALSFLKGLLVILRSSGLAGLVWVVDEVETVQRLPNSRQREASYESLRILVDQVAENAFPGLFLIVTGTPRLFEDPRYGIPSYQALKDRITKLSFPNGRHSVRQPVLTLQGFDFGLLLEVAKKIREIHGSAYNWQSDQRLTDDQVTHLAELAVSAFSGHIERTPRVFLREIVHLCDMLHEHPTLAADEYFKDDAIVAARLSPPGSRFTEPRDPASAAS
jgi:hypothetical protein